MKKLKLSRRDFLKQAAAFTAATALPHQALLSDPTSRVAAQVKEGIEHDGRTGRQENR